MFGARGHTPCAKQTENLVLIYSTSTGTTDNITIIC